MTNEQEIIKQQAERIKTLETICKLKQAFIKYLLQKGAYRDVNRQAD